MESCAVNLEFSGLSLRRILVPDLQKSKPGLLARAQAKLVMVSQCEWLNLEPRAVFASRKFCFSIRPLRQRYAALTPLRPTPSHLKPQSNFAPSARKERCP